MLQTRIYLTCDGCGNPWPRCGNLPSSVDGAIYTPAQLRAEARDMRCWSTSNRKHPHADYCERCARKLREKGGK
jgi:hypothetical protein